MKALTLPDMGFLYCETVSRPNHVAAMQIFDMPNNDQGDYGEELYQQLMQFTQIEKPFNYKLHTAYSGLMYWQEDDNIDLDYHVRQVRLPTPGGREQLLEYIEHAHSNLMDRNRPLWEMHLISGLANGQFAVYLKMHHAFTDGVKANSILLSYLTTQANGKLKAFWTQTGFESEQPDTEVKASMVSKLKQSSAILTKQVRAIPSILGLGSKLILQGVNVYKANIITPFTSPKTPFSISPKRARRASTSILPLSRVRNIGKIAGTTVNDVVVCICDIALHRYLSDLNYQLKQPLTAQIPVSLRDANDITSNNRIAITMIELAHSSATPLSRLMAIKDACNKLKQETSLLSDEALTSYTLASQGLAVISELLNLDNVLPPVGNVLISNVPGPRKPMYMMGAKMQECFPLSALPPGMSLNITLYSYMNNINVGLIACRSNLPELTKLSSYIDDAFTELEQAVMNSAIDIVSEQIARLGHDDVLSNSMHELISVINDNACSTVVLDTAKNPVVAVKEDNQKSSKRRVVKVAKRTDDMLS
ncbi:wax ester/triacylglycerol synthase family O-acyltransferase [Moritella sp. F3]|uniref:wax ester/triacylglycerol synthase family O-acyltransferase n=1 Tax=Moritella sp. F3 TaxID=2718882 RepID=UPI0018E0EF7C|nr:wax ester/triacylglycerol synthase family O-acyltransferase [Moritella sp. F3]GIC76588.1 putative diacyglycerol O-acyltransferase [Moritella sp. F1]GIC81659.1 putative diacyglycerol O-acyltransferase [Moritella sp. F3]